MQLSKEGTRIAVNLENCKEIYFMTITSFHDDIKVIKWSLRDMFLLRYNKLRNNKADSCAIPKSTRIHLNMLQFTQFYRFSRFLDAYTRLY